MTGPDFAGLVREAAGQLGAITGTEFPWTVHVYRYRRSAGGASLVEALPLVPIADRIGRVARAAARLHAPVLGDWGILQLSGGRVPAGATLAVPTLDPAVIDPSPVVRPVLGVVAYTSGLTPEALLDRADLLETANRYSELLVRAFPEQNPSPGRPDEGELAVEAPAAGPPLETRRRLAGRDGRAWVEYAPGLLATEDALSAYELRLRSVEYDRSKVLHRPSLSTPEENRRRILELMKPFTYQDE